VSNVEPISFEEAKTLVESDDTLRTYSNFGFTIEQIMSAAQGGIVPEIERLRDMLVRAQGSEGMTPQAQAAFRTALEDGYGVTLNEAVNFVRVLDEVSGRTKLVEDTQAAVETANATGQEPQLPPGVVVDPTTGQISFAGPMGQPEQEGDSRQVRANLRIGAMSIADVVAQQLPLRVDLSNVVEVNRVGRVPGPSLVTATDAAGVRQVAGTQRPSQMPAGLAPGEGPVTIPQAMQWLYSLSQRELEQMQDRMKAAGYYTQQGYNPESGQYEMIDVPYERGFADDVATKQAYVALLTDAAAQDRKVDEVLRTSSMDFERRRQNAVEQVTEQRRGTFASALGDVREAADQLAIQTLGRRLMPEEYVQVRQYVRGLQEERMGQVVGRTLEPWMRQAPEAGFTSDELEQEVGNVLVESQLDEPGANYWSRLRRKYES